jgi:hypothetical protein
MRERYAMMNASALGRDALRAPTVQHNFVRLELESFRGEPRKVARAPVDLKDAGAFATAKVMMMLGPRTFVARGFARELYRDQPAGLDQRVDRPVDGGDAQALDVLAACIEHFEGTQRTRNLLEDLPNGVPLPRFAFHP